MLVVSMLLMLPKPIVLPSILMGTVADIIKNDAHREAAPDIQHFMLE